MALLDILIPTMPSREKLLARLLCVLAPQVRDRADVKIVVDGGTEIIGIKRDRMVAESRAEYVVFVDDDDLVATDYVASIMSALQAQPDCVAISMYVKRDGLPWEPNPLFEHSLKHRKNIAWSGNKRTPHHLCPIRREIAAKSSFGTKQWGEDYDFAMGVLPHLKLEAVASEHPLYLYDYRSKPHAGG